MNRNLIPAIHALFRKLNGLAPAPHIAQHDLLTPENPEADIEQFVAYLQESGSGQGLFYLQTTPEVQELAQMLGQSKIPLLVFEVAATGLVPVVVLRIGAKYEVYRFTSARPEKVRLSSVNDLAENCALVPGQAENRTFVLTGQVHQAAAGTLLNKPKKVSPVGRLFQLLAIEKKQIGYIYVYAAIAGIISLSLPLGIQSIIGFVSGGQMSTSIIVLIAFIVIGMLVVGALQLMQVWLLEHLQQRLFSRLSFDFTYRVPRFQMESLQNTQPVELMNRFFETMTLQKGVAKILLEFNAAVLQIVFGLILLSLYHPWFIFFGLFLALILGLIIWFTGGKGIETSLTESKYKYQLASWLDSLAKAMYTFKLSGYANLSMQKTDYITSHYILARREHFRVLMTQYLSFVFFKALITAGLLILGCILVLQQQINIGQFVAAEIIIILIMNSVEKIILKLEVVYDVLTGLEKITAVTEMPLEEKQGLNIADSLSGQGLAVQASCLSYKGPSDTQISLHHINLSVAPSEKICLTSFSDDGKFTLTQVLLGMAPGYQGRLSFNNLSFRDLDIAALRNQTGAVIASDQLFEGTLLQNITCGAPGITATDVQKALDSAGLSEYVQHLPKGLHTHLAGTDWQLPRSIVSKIMMARCFVRKPRLVILDNNLLAIGRAEKIRMFRALHEQTRCTLIIISHDKKVMQFCDKVWLMDHGTITHQGTYQQLQPHLPVQDLTETNI